ncbi:hypothetical protein EVAR_39812_1 [Eumeta japonica]|uniref:Uncharacterized protein n=1 Tax=Eumeta variegata TaxID=151549 RepID=A0A4C1XBH4_EUMVA|nr:hypothetical protein EVAR_39812_1 [Eumeta japonica]
MLLASFLPLANVIGLYVRFESISARAQPRMKPSIKYCYKVYVKMAARSGRTGVSRRSRTRTLFQCNTPERMHDSKFRAGARGSLAGSRRRTFPIIARLIIIK